MKRFGAALATVVLLVAAVLLSRNADRDSKEGPQDATVQEPAGSIVNAGSGAANGPEQCIEAMFSAAKRGDVEAYIDCFTGTERAELQRELSRQSRQLFAESLADALQPLKGRAIVSEPVPRDAKEAQITVERVYANHNEIQVFQLRRGSGRWRIYEVGNVQTQQPPIKYGTPVYGPVSK